MSRIGTGSSFEGNNRVGKYSLISGKVGKYTYFGSNVKLVGTIGRFSSISSWVQIISGRHPIKAPYVATSPMFFAKSTPLGHSFVQKQLFEEFAYADEDNKVQVIIGNDCWIGYGVSIVGGVIIGDGAVVLANATVTKDVPPYAIVGGVPAKVLGYRYDAATIEKLLAVKWWDKEDSWIKENAMAFSDIDAFLKL
jgi:acetyltransferase-like isoleucine patch superfamily enzyme